MKTIVQKFGGATISSPEKIRDLACRIADLKKSGHNVIVVVSAMGKTTNDLLSLANQVSHRPPRREMDMLLTAGERISMSLMSMALSDQGTPAISFTGSQAGIFTNENHSNALISDIRPIRIEEALSKGNIVVTAGFQGVSPITKDVTTLGRGGSDTTAVALAAHFKANPCEILKDVDGVFSADPKLIAEAELITEMSYDHLIDMTFWGAKFLHARASQLAKVKKVPLVVRSAHNDSPGTVIKDLCMYEFEGVLSVNSHESVFEIELVAGQAAEALWLLEDFLNKNQLVQPQILKVVPQRGHCTIFLTAPSEVLVGIDSCIQGEKSLKLRNKDLASVSATCTGSTSPQLYRLLFDALKSRQIDCIESLASGMSFTFFVSKKERENCIQALHGLKI